jgi:hypothetical protein
MTIIYDRKEVHLCNPSLEELAEAIEEIRSQPIFDDFKIMIDGFDENTVTEGELYLSK